MKGAQGGEGGGGGRSEEGKKGNAKKSEAAGAGSEPVTQPTTADKEHRGTHGGTMKQQRAHGEPRPRARSWRAGGPQQLLRAGDASLSELAGRGHCRLGFGVLFGKIKQTPTYPLPHCPVSCTSCTTTHTANLGSFRVWNFSRNKK